MTRSVHRQADERRTAAEKGIVVAAPSGRDAGTVPAVTRGATLPLVAHLLWGKPWQGERRVQDVHDGVARRGRSRASNRLRAKQVEAGNWMLDFWVRRGIAQSGSAPALGAGGRGFESLCPDQMKPF